MSRSFAAFVFQTAALFALFATASNAAPPEVATWEEANARRMFVVCNDRDAIAAIVVDTTHPEHLQTAIRLQELVYRIAAARLPIVDREFAGDPWLKIHIAWDHYPMTPREHAFTITMKESDPTFANPPKQIIISGSGPASPSAAVSAFTQAAFGVPLSALDDKNFQWPTRKVLAIPEKFGPIYPDRSDRNDRKKR